MNETDFIKKTISNFIELSIKETKKIGLKDGSQMNINKTIYEIQNHFNSELNRYNINTKLNESIISDSILKSFEHSKYGSHKPNYYAFPFLKFICLNYRPSEELNLYIDGFLNQYKDQLSWNDLVITKTGATRAKTNIRFALHFLRDLNLIHHKNKLDKRTISPTVLGQLIVLYLHFLNKKFKPLVHPEEKISFDGLCHFNARLNTLKNPEELKDFLEYIHREHKLSEEDKVKVKNYLLLFIEIILNNIQISKTGVKFDKNMNEKSEYKKLLNQLSEDTIHFDLSILK